MTSYFIRRMLLIIPTFLGITLLVFAITRMVPGGPVERMIAEARQAMVEGGSQANEAMNEDGMPLSEDQLNELKAFYGLDKPMVPAYAEWLTKVVVFDLGESTRYYEPVWDTIKERLPISTFYGLITVFLTYLICIPLGLLKAIKHNTPFDNFGYAVPGYVVGIILLVLLASNYELFPLGGFISDNHHELGFWAKIKDLLYHAVLPLCAYMLGSFAVMTFLMKNSVIENLSADYVRTSIAKGLEFKKAVRKHALRNSLIPLATHFGNNISLFITGSFLIETIFNIDGIGLLGYESVLNRDYAVVMGILVISSLLYLLGNILSDICVALVDPRVQFK